MAGGIKQAIKDLLSASCRREYFSSLKRQLEKADRLRVLEEERLQKRPMRLAVTKMTFEEFCDTSNSATSDSDLILIYNHRKGLLSPVAESAFAEYFEKHEEVCLAYANEDILLYQEEKETLQEERRILPYLKPTYAPETLLAFQYVGNVFAIRRNLLMEREGRNDVEEMVYAYLLHIFGKYEGKRIGQLPQILFHRYEKMQENCTIDQMEKLLREQDECLGSGSSFEAIKQEFLQRQNINGHFEEGHFRYELPTEKPLVSILIPSKDNPEVLRNCIDSIKEKTTYSPYEIIVIDNGSKEVCRDEIAKNAEEKEFTYLYSPQEFNYSRMNNEAAKHAGGSVYVLLNDDMEVITPDWLERMLGQLLIPGVGAVGAKLYYPDSVKIQHVGITNSPEDGPVHKLWQEEDTRSYAHGRNRLDVNVMAVTGACLMVRSEDYEACGGLDETLSVSYNDVDLCFNLLEMNKRAVLRNDVLLYHHESLSRGHDISAEKRKRLSKERADLFKKHPGYFFKDPYDPVQIAEENGTDIQLSKITRGTEKKLSYPQGIAVEIRQSGEVLDKDGETGIYEIRGTMVVPMVDNATYSFSLLLQREEGDIYELSIHRLLSPVLSERFPTASNVRLGGFAACFEKGSLPAGRYQVYAYTKDHSSSRRLCHNTETVLEIN